MYYIVYGLLYAVSLLPLGILYIFSDFIYFLLYYVFGYRKKVVMANLLQAFPERKGKQLQKNFTETLPIRLLKRLKRFLQPKSL